MKTPAACSPEDPGDGDDFHQQVYDVLRQMADARPLSSRLQLSAFVHEVWLRMGGEEKLSGQNRPHFFKAAAEAVRRILVDQAFRWGTDRHGEVQRWGNEKSLDNAKGELPTDDQLLQVSEALKKLQEIDQQKAELVKLRYYLGMSFKEVADTMGISVTTAKRWWIFARSWLHREISSQ